MTAVRRVAGRSVTTVEGLDPALRTRWTGAFCNAGASQCGFCTPGQIMSAIALIEEGETEDDPERVREAMSGNLCRCGAYQGITEAVLEAQKALGAANKRKVA